MHDSRGAEIKVGDKVLIEAEVTELNGGDENFCCCTVAITLPEQSGQAGVMNHRPTVSAMSTKMLTKIGTKVITSLALLFALCLPASAQTVTTKVTPNADGSVTIEQMRTAQQTRTVTVQQMPLILVAAPLPSTIVFVHVMGPREAARRTLGHPVRANLAARRGL